MTRRYFRLSLTATTAVVTALAACLFTVTNASRAQDAVGLETRIAALEAREAIRELIFAYGRALDTRDFRTFAALFDAEQGTWVGGFGSATGRDAIFALMDDSIGHADEPVVPRSHHVFSNIQIGINGDRASATTKWTFVVPSETGDPRWLYLGHYDDEFVRRGGQWFFLRREAFTDIPVQ